MALRRSCDGLRSFIRRPANKQIASLPSHQFFSSRADLDDDEEAPRCSRKKKPSKSNPSSDGSANTSEGSATLSAKPSKDSTIAATKDSDSLLIKSLKKQLNEATDLANKYQVEVRGSFKPFEVVASEGSSDLTLRRLIGKEEVLVKCLLDLDDPQLEGDDEDASSENDDRDDDELRISQRVTLNVQISKGSSEEDQPRVAFLCSYAKGETITIADVAYLGKSVHEEYPYSGPYFPDLDANLKQVFQNVIKTRGINSSLADTIMEHLTNQYQVEYIGWLKKVRAFLKR